MDADEKKWIEEAVDQCSRAKQKGVTLVLVRRQDENGEGDYIVTNADNHKLVAAMNGNYEPGDADTDE